MSSAAPRKQDQRDLDIEAILWVKRLAIKKSLKAVMFAFATESNRRKGHTCYPGQKRIAAIAGVSVRTVSDAIAELVELGLITVSERRDAHGNRTSSLYTLCLPAKSASNLPAISASPTCNSCADSESLHAATAYKGKNSLQEKEKQIGGGKPTPLPPAKNIQEEAGKIKTEEKIKSVVAACVAAGYDSLVPAEGLADFYDRLGPQPDAVLVTMFGNWDSYRKFAAVTHDAWWFKKSGRLPVVADLTKNAFTAAIAATAFHNQYAAEHAAEQAKNAKQAAKELAEAKKKQAVQMMLAQNAEYGKLVALIEQLELHKNSKLNTADQLPFFTKELWDQFIKWCPQFAQAAPSDCPAWRLPSQLVAGFGGRCYELERAAKEEYDAQQEAV